MHLSSRRCRIWFLQPLCVALAGLMLGPAVVTAGDWPEFRGPTGQGISTEKNLPIRWSETENITWKQPVPGRGWSSPSIAGGQIWLTTATDDDTSLRAICLDKKSGKILHNVELFTFDETPKVHRKNTPASPTPVIEGDRVYVHFGTLGTACLSTSGEVIWKTQELVYNHRHGPGGSPVIYQDLLVISCDGTDVQFVVGIDKQTGKIKWRTDREGKMAYSTPLLIPGDAGEQLISTGGEWVMSYEPATGKEIWRSNYPGGYSLVPRPVYGDGLVFVCSGYNTPVLYAIRPDGQGDVTESHVAWKMERGAPHNPSPLLLDGLLYVVSDRGILTCVEAKTGEEVYRERLEGNYSASPVYADGKIYVENETALTIVFTAGREFREISRNQLDGRTLSTLAPSDGAIFLRTDTHLYRIEDK